MKSYPVIILNDLFCADRMLQGFLCKQNIAALPVGRALEEVLVLALKTLEIFSSWIHFLDLLDFNIINMGAETINPFTRTLPTL